MKINLLKKVGVLIMLLGPCSSLNLSAIVRAPTSGSIYLGGNFE